MADNITQVGNKTLVSKILYGTPYRTAVISSSADINAIAGLNVANAIDGSIIIYDSDTGEWVSGSVLQNLIIDGRVYPSDSDRTKILIRRSGTQGDPLKLRSGELAYSWLSDSETDGFGNGGDRLFIGVGGDSEVNGELVAKRIEVIGGKYFTDLLNHPHGVLTPNSAVIVDSDKKLNEFFVNLFEADSAKINKLTIIDSADIANLSVNSLLVTNFITDGSLSLNNLSVSGNFSVDGATTFSDSVDIQSSLKVSGSLSVDSNLSVLGATNLDSVTANSLAINDTLVTNNAQISGKAVFDSSATFNSNVFIGDITLREFIDSSVFGLLISGQAVALSYNDSANTLEISTLPASTTTPGIASFDSDQFSVDSNGAVSILELNGGTF